ncbi:MAG: peptidoglycan editing factor PgeF [Anaerolineae bacterium]|nr:peptidoglycan editing factor PgeF [Anaerolineae bacterium]
MPFHQPDSLRYYTFASFADLPVAHAVFTRHGGVSPSPWNSLNLSSSTGDSLPNIAENRIRCFDVLGRPAESFYDSWLVHGVSVAVADHPHPPDPNNAPKADIIISNNPDVTLVMRYADCVPIFLYDPANHAVALAHAGWKGTVDRVAAVAVQALVDHFASDPADIHAAIGPSIAAHHYPVGPDVVAKVKASFPNEFAHLVPQQNGSPHFDLWAANQLTLEQAGVRHVEVAGLCTACQTDDWFSHRAENGRTGRFGALIGLHPA